MQKSGNFIRTKNAILIVRFFSMCAFLVGGTLALPAHGNSTYDTWERNTEPFYRLDISDIASFDESSAELYEPLSESGGARIKMSAMSTDGGVFDVVCFAGCQDSLKYENNSGATLCYDCRLNENCMLWDFLGYCAVCPDTGVSGVPPQIRPDFTAPVYHDIRDCAIPSGTETNDSSGSFSYTDDCHYEK